MMAALMLGDGSDDACLAAEMHMASVDTQHGHSGSADELVSHWGAWSVEREGEGEAMAKLLAALAS